MPTTPPIYITDPIEAINAECERRRLSPAELARMAVAAGITTHPHSVYHWLAGRRDPPAETAGKLLALLKLTIRRHR